MNKEDMNKLLDAALQYRKMGLSVIAADALKQSIVKWADFQQASANVDEVARMFNLPHAANIAVVTGTVSGNLEVVDIDSKYDLQGNLLERLLSKTREFDEGLVHRLVI